MNVLALIDAATDTLVAHVAELTALDQAIGDGDHGLNMKRGALAIQARRDELADKSLNEALKMAGTTCMAKIGGSSGPVFGTLLVTLAKELPSEPDHVTPPALSAALAAGIAALTRLGKAEVGQKTLLDVLAPVQALLASAPAHESTDALCVAVARCALDAAAATAQMDATRGRASFLGDRALGHVDPGSRSTALIIAAVCDKLGTNQALRTAP
jgi:dihydroxyacetone kinase-like protein